jgi:hypothetical protein
MDMNENWKRGNCVYVEFGAGISERNVCNAQGSKGIEKQLEP